MDPRLDFIAEMESAINAPTAVKGIDVFRIANNLSVKLQILFESKTMEGVAVHKIRRTSRWSVKTCDYTWGIGYEVKKQSWQKYRQQKIRIIEKANLEQVSLDPRGLLFHSIPGVSTIFHDSDGYRIRMTRTALFSSSHISLGQWKGCQLLRFKTKHLMDRSSEEAYWRWMHEKMPDCRQPEIFITCGELIEWYRHLSGAHSAATIPHQLRAEKMPSGKFFVRPLYFSTRKEYFRTALALRPVRKVVAALVILLASEVYTALIGTTQDCACWFDCPKLGESNACDITTVASVLAPLAEPPENMFRQVANIVPFIDERVRGSYDGFFLYDPPDPAAASPQ